MSKRGLSFDKKMQRTLTCTHEWREAGIGRAKGVGESISAADQRSHSSSDGRRGESGHGGGQVGEGSRRE